MHLCEHFLWFPIALRMKATLLPEGHRATQLQHLVPTLLPWATGIQPLWPLAPQA